jgi:hypothetical protein
MEGRPMRSFLTIGCALFLSSVQGGPARAVPKAAAPAPAFPKLPVFEGRTIALTSEQMAALARGEPVVEMLTPKDDRVVAAFGIIAIKTTRKAFTAGLTNFALSLRAQGIENFGLFKTPATSANVGAFAINASDAAALKKCHLGKCEFKLPASEMARAKAMLEGADGPAKLAAYGRGKVAEYVTGYRARGNAAMVVYDDFGKGGVRAADAFAALLAASPYLKENAPEVQQYLQQYPRGRPGDASEAIYWSEETLKGLRPTVTINHIVVSSTVGASAMTSAVTKQLYSDHYFEGMLDERFVVDRRDAPGGAGIYLIVLRQYRFDNLPGGVLNIRGRAKSAMQERMVAELRRTQSAASH